MPAKTKKTTSLINAKRFQSPKAIVLAALLVIASVALIFYSKASTPDCNNPATFIKISGLGPACKLSNGLFKMVLPSGKVLYSHGADGPAPTKATANTTGTTTWNYGMVAPTCVNQNVYHNHLIYANPAGHANNFSGLSNQIYQTMEYANGNLHNEGKAFGLNINLKFWCSIDNVDLSTSSTNYYDVVNDLASKGYNSNLAKYWVFVDTPCVGGVAGIANDDSLSPNNANNFGPGYALDLGCIDDGGVMTHEDGHMMGAVQQSAPHSTTGWHCNDGYSFMCYGPDGSSNSNWYKACPNISYDCNNDDYFNPYPKAGTYLATHWNIASGYNNFISGLPAPPKDTTPPTAPSGLAGSPRNASQIALTWNGSTDTQSGVAGYNIYRDNALVGTTTEPTYYFTDSGLGPNTYHTYGVKAFDTAGNLSDWSNPVTVQTYRLCLYLCIH